MRADRHPDVAGDLACIEVDVADHADAVHRLLTSLGSKQARRVGSAGGKITAPTPR